MYFVLNGQVAWRIVLFSKTINFKKQVGGRRGKKEFELVTKCIDKRYLYIIIYSDSQKSADCKQRFENPSSKISAQILPGN